MKIAGKMYYNATDEEIAEIGNDEFDKLVQAEAKHTWGKAYNAEDYEWSETPPHDGTCLACYRWERFPRGNRHFGWIWRRICNSSSPWRPLCACEHHKDEIWIG